MDPAKNKDGRNGSRRPEVPVNLVQVVLLGVQIDLVLLVLQIRATGVLQSRQQSSRLAQFTSRTRTQALLSAPQSGAAALGCGCGEIGRRTRFRFWRRKAWGFKSLHPHHIQHNLDYTVEFVNSILIVLRSSPRDSNRGSQSRPHPCKPKQIGKTSCYQWLVLDNGSDAKTKRFRTNLGKFLYSSTLSIARF